MSYQAYQKVQQSSETPSQIEYRLFAQVTNALMAVQGKPPRDPEVAKALDWNRRMWSTLSTDCGAKGNALPAELRAGIISLSLFVSKHSSEVMRGKESVDDLININRTVMEGLAAQASLQQKQQAATQPEEAKPINSIL